MLDDDLIFQEIKSEDYKLLDQLNENLYGSFPILNASEKLNTDYAKNRNLGIVVKTNQGNLVASYLVFPILLNNNGDLIWVCQAGNSMVHPYYVGRNIIVKSGLILYDILVKNNYRAVFGIPSKSILRTRLKLLKWQKHSVIHSYNIFIPTIPIFLLSRKFSFIQNYHKRYVKFLADLLFKKGDYFDASDKYNISNNVIFVERSSEYWKYKLKNSDIYLLKSGKYNFVLKMSRELYLGDIDFKEGCPNILFKLKLFIFFVLSLNASFRFFCTKGSHIEQFFRYFSNPKESLNFCSRSFDQNISLENIKFTYFDFDTF